MELVKNNDAITLDYLKEMIQSFSKLDSDEIELVKSYCEKYISKLIMSGLSSSNELHHLICSYALSIGVSYTETPTNIMQVVFRGDSRVLNINALNVINFVKNDREIYFILAHEMEHIICGHNLRYFYLFADEVTSVLMNICADVEVNERLRSILSSDSPSDLITLAVFTDFFRLERDVVKASIISMQYKKKMALADACYQLLGKEIEEVLGKSVSSILYTCKLHKCSFKNEVIKVSLGGDSGIFKIKTENRSDAIRLCTKIAQYLDKHSLIVISPSRNGFSIDSDDMYEISSTGADIIDMSSIMLDVEDASSSFMGGCKAGSASMSGNDERADVNLPDQKTIIPWQAVLKNRMTISSNEWVRTRSRINRRQPYRLELSGRKHKNVLNLILAIDESGSIDNDEYSFFVQEVTTLLKNIDCILTILEFGSDVYRCTEFDMRCKSKNKDALKSLYTSRFSSGTSFQPIFDYVHDNIKNYRRSFLCVLTDGESWEDSLNFYGINHLWVLPGHQANMSNGYKYLCDVDSSSNVFNLTNMR